MDFSSNEARRKFPIASQGGISPERAGRLLRENGAVLTSVNKNCLYLHSSKETAKHWMVKALVLKLLRDLERTAGTEVEVVGGIVDVLDLDNFVGYEVEMSMSRTRAEAKARRLWQLHDVVFIDAHKVPNDIDAAEEYLRDIVF
jgi:hypothetical protein